MFRWRNLVKRGSLWRRLLRRSRQTQSGCVRSVTRLLTTQLILPGKKSRPKARTWINCEVATQMLTHRELLLWIVYFYFCVVVIIGFLFLYTVWFGVVLCTLYGLSLRSLNMGTYVFNSYCTYILFYLCELIGLLAFMLKLAYELVWIMQCSLYMRMYGFNLYILYYLLIKLWYTNYRSLSRKTIIRWNIHKLILHPHDIRSWNMQSCYLANLDGSSNKQFSMGSKLTITSDCFNPREGLHTNLFV